MAQCEVIKEAYFCCGIIIAVSLLFLFTLPVGWTRMAFRLLWRGRQIRCEIRQPTRRVTLVLERGAAMTVQVGTASP